MVLKCLCFFHHLEKHTQSKRPYPTVIEELCHPFSLADLTKATNNFDQKNVVREGEFGKVYKGCCLKVDHVDTAVTVRVTQPYSTSFRRVLERLKKETEFLCQLRHPNLVSLIGFCTHNYSIFTVFKDDIMSNGSLADCLFKRDDRKALSWKKRLEICIGAARAVHYLHAGLKRIVIHHDIKASNILLDDNMVPKLSQFTCSLLGAPFAEKPKPIEGKNFPGTLSHVSPEQHSTGSVSDKCDVYSFGMVLLEVVCSKPIDTIMKMRECREQQREETEMSNSYCIPYNIKVQAEDIDPILAGNITPQCYEAYIDITERCLKKEPDERPTMGEVEVLLEHALTLQQEADDDATDTSHDYL